MASKTATTDLSGANSYQGFKSLVSRQVPATANLYWIRFRSVPTVLAGWNYGVQAFNNNSYAGGPGTDQARLLTYYATDVTVPSRQITTGEAKQVGAMYRYATGTSFSEISIQFILPRSMFTRMLFERWMNYTANDASQKVAFYDDYVCSHIDIFKYERGGVSPVAAGPSYGNLSKLQRTNVDRFYKTAPKWNRLSGVWTLKNAYPFNISNINMNAQPNGLLTMDVSFYFERYRFYYPKTNETNIPDINVPVNLGVSSSKLLQSVQGQNSINPNTGHSPTVIVGGGNVTII